MLDAIVSVPVVLVVVVVSAALLVRDIVWEELQAVRHRGDLAPSRPARDRNRRSALVAVTIALLLVMLRFSVRAG